MNVAHDDSPPCSAQACGNALSDAKVKIKSLLLCHICRKKVCAFSQFHVWCGTNNFTPPVICTEPFLSPCGGVCRIVEKPTFNKYVGACEIQLLVAYSFMFVLDVKPIQ